MRLFRARLVARLVERHAISQALAAKLLSWRHPGFSVHVGEPIAASDAQALEDMAGYVVRNPSSLKRLVYLDGQQAVICRALKPNPSLGQSFVAMDPLERPQVELPVRPKRDSLPRGRKTSEVLDRGRGGPVTEGQWPGLMSGWRA
jgi:hypothetical protein